MATLAASQKIRVAVVSEPGKAGVKTHVVDLLQGLDLDRFEVTYYYSLQRSDNDYPGQLQALAQRGINCVEVPIEGALKPKADLRALANLTGKLRRQRPHILHLHSSKAGGIGRLASVLVWPRPWVIYTPHAMACYRSKFYLWLERILSGLTHVPMAVSASEKTDFINWRIPRAHKTMTLTMGVRMPQHEPASPADGRAELLVGACGRICHQKNARLFFELALSLVKQGNFRFRWIGDFGDDDEARAVRQLLDAAGSPGQIEITGWVSDPLTHLRQLDVFCMFSRYESFGYVTAEAMALGVPVVATPSTGTIDLVQHEVTGLLAEPNVKSLEAAVQRLAADRPLREQLTANARRLIAEKHTIERMVGEVEQLYQTLVS